jgi:hypothetical protein
MAVSIDEYLLKTAHQLDDELSKFMDSLTSSYRPISPSDSDIQFGFSKRRISKGIFRYKKSKRHLILLKAPNLSRYRVEKELLKLWEAETQEVRDSWNNSNRTQ